MLIHPRVSTVERFLFRQLYACVGLQQVAIGRTITFALCTYIYTHARSHAHIHTLVHTRTKTHTNVHPHSATAHGTYWRLP